LGDYLPKYVCPSCGREVELPEGSYYCKYCGATLVPAESEFEKAMKEELGYILKELNYAVKDVIDFYNKHQDLDFIRKLSLEFRDFIKAKNALFDKAAKLGVPVV